MGAIGKKCPKISLLLVLALLMSLWTSALAAAAPESAPADELNGHWAEKQLRTWVEGGLLQGDDRGVIHPDRAITRAELISLINRAFMFTEKKEIYFTDIDPSNWAYEPVSIAVQAGYTRGYEDNTIRASQSVTREEAAVMIANALMLEGDAAGSSLSAFTDAGNISDWSKPYIAALTAKQLLHGTPAGTINPQGKLTRAEAVTILDQAIPYAKQKVVYQEAGTYGPGAGTETIRGDVIVSAAGVSLRNVVIEGDLTIAEEVGEGDVNFNNVTVKGTTTIQGGGENSIHFEDSVLVRVIVDKRTGTVRVVAVGSSSIQSVIVSSPVKLEETHATDSGFKNVELSSALPTGSAVTLSGQFEDVSVFSSDVRVSIPSGSVQQLNIGEEAKGAQVEISSEAKVLDLVLNAVAKLLGQGTIGKATVNDGAKGSTFEKKPESLAGNAANEISITQPTPPGQTSGGTVPPNDSSDDDDDNGDGPVPQPGTCEGTTEQCENAELAGLSVAGYTLNQLDANYYTLSQTGFKPDVLAYSVVTDNQSDSLTVSVTKSVYTVVNLTFYDSYGSYIKSESMANETAEYDVQFNPNEDVTIFINVKSADLLGTKQYRLFIQHPRTMQEAVKIDTMYFYRLQEGVTVTETTYILNIGTIGGEKARDTDTVKVTQGGNPVLECKGTYCTIPKEKVATSGVWHIEIYRDGSLWKEGDYAFHFGEVPMIREDVGLTVKALTTQELNQEFVKNVGSTNRYKFGYKVYLDRAKLMAVLPGAKYYHNEAEFMGGTLSAWPPALSSESLKTKQNPYFYSGHSIPARQIPTVLGQDQSLTGAYYLLNENDTDTTVEDAFVRFAFYDENMNVIGQTIVVLTFDEGHLAEGYTPGHNWQP